MALTTNNVAISQCLVNELDFPKWQVAKWLGITRQGVDYYTRDTYLGTTWKFRAEYQKEAIRRAADLVMFRAFIVDDRLMPNDGSTERWEMLLGVQNREIERNNDA